MKADPRPNNGPIELVESLGASGAAEGARQASWSPAPSSRQQQELLEVEVGAGQEGGAPCEVVGPRDVEADGRDAGRDGGNHAGAQVGHGAHDDHTGAPHGAGREPLLKAQAASVEGGAELRREFRRSRHNDLAVIAVIAVCVVRQRGVDPRRHDGGFAGDEAGLEGPVEIAVGGVHAARRRGQDPMSRSLIAGVDDHGHHDAATHERRHAARMGAVGVDGDGAVAGPLLSQRAGQGIGQNEVPQLRHGARAGDGQKTLPERFDLVGIDVVEHVAACDEAVGDAVNAAVIEGENVIDDDVRAGDGVDSEQVQDGGHVQPRLMRAMGWMFISGLSS